MDKEKSVQRRKVLAMHGEKARKDAASASDPTLFLIPSPMLFHLSRVRALGSLSLCLRTEQEGTKFVSRLAARMSAWPINFVLLRRYFGATESCLALS